MLLHFTYMRMNAKNKRLVNEEECLVIAKFNAKENKKWNTIAREMEDNERNHFEAIKREDN